MVTEDKCFMGSIRKYLIYAILALISFGFTEILLSRIKRLKSENERLSANQEALMSDVKTWQYKDSIWAAETKAITLDRDELKAKNDSIKKELKKLGVRCDELKSTQQVEIRTEIKEVLVPIPVTVDSVQCFEYSDKWNYRKVCFKTGKLPEWEEWSLNRLNIYVSEKPKHRFWFFKWGRRTTLMYVTSDNPKSKITGSELIFVE